VTSAISHRHLGVNGITLHVAEAGAGPTVVLLHGFPELWYSWRHQLPALAAAGYHAVAPDLRGYGESSRPDRVGDYAMTSMVGDVIGLLDTLGAEAASVVGHDWGANIAWTLAQLHPERVSSLAALSVPLQPRPPLPPTQILRAMGEQRFNWALYFQELGVAEAELETDARRTLRLIFFALSGDAPTGLAERLLTGLPAGSRLLDPIPEPEQLPTWLSSDDLEVYTGAFVNTGFTGALNRYRNLDRDWADLADAGARPIERPVLFLGGGVDSATRFVDHQYMEQAVPGLARVILPRCGHWIQQEQPQQVSHELVAFLDDHTTGRHP
jgi:pimeloyl-ACP methyl ester carboxylesterase